jgi:pimeloyl-ACP methyl ester carboxylesterase
MRIVSLGFISVLLLSPISSFAGVAIPVDAPPNSRYTNDPAYTLLYEVKNPQVTLIVIPGGDGHLGFDATTTDGTQQIVQMTKKLADPQLTGLRINVVIYDNPYPMESLKAGSGMRSADDHIKRIANVVEYYNNKFKVPIILMGHSWGSVSVAAYLNRHYQSPYAISGAILSASKNSIDLDKNQNIPILFLHHESDACRQSPFGSAKDLYEDTKKVNKSQTQFQIVTGGEAGSQPCSDGYHMYAGSYELADRYIQEFIKENFQVKR